MGDVDSNTMNTFIKLLQESNLRDTKVSVLNFLLGLTGSNEGLEIIYQHGKLIFNVLFIILLDSDSEIASRAANIILNISAENQGVDLLLSIKFDSSKIRVLNPVCKDAGASILNVLIEDSLYRDSTVNQKTSAILSNLSRNPVAARQIFDSLLNFREILALIISRLLRSKSIDLDYLTSFLSNLCQLEEVCGIFLEPSSEYLEKLSVLIHSNQSALRRKGVIGLVRNLCISTVNYEKLLDPDIDLLSRLLLPLAGPEEFDDEDNEKLPIDLQYLPDDKFREPDPEIRLMLVEILTQLCSTRYGREILRKNNVYIILREYHKWEVNKEILLVLENLVNFLIRTEDEIGADNLKEIDVPTSISDS